MRVVLEMYFTRFCAKTTPKFRVSRRVRSRRMFFTSSVSSPARSTPASTSEAFSECRQLRRHLVGGRVGDGVDDHAAHRPRRETNWRGSRRTARRSGRARSSPARRATGTCRRRGCRRRGSGCWRRASRRAPWRTRAPRPFPASRRGRSVAGVDAAVAGIEHDQRAAAFAARGDAGVRLPGRRAVRVAVGLGDGEELGRGRSARRRRPAAPAGPSRGRHDELLVDLHRPGEVDDDARAALADDAIAERGDQAPALLARRPRAARSCTSGMSMTMR